ncbi:hypothetical protein KSP39_PZI008356 [Platanthera zijinensis]|uniref:Uncharacterized protein n=1 Tax=Platanthera zijinensis TaxID=2320716 RepID=A0AAP0BPN3_9ASPA
MALNPAGSPLIRLSSISSAFPKRCAEVEGVRVSGGDIASGDCADTGSWRQGKKGKGKEIAHKQARLLSEEATQRFHSLQSVPPIYERAILPWVYEFYANAPVTEGGKVFIRGKKVDFSAAAINTFFDLDNDIIPDHASVLTTVPKEELTVVIWEALGLDWVNTKDLKAKLAGVLVDRLQHHLRPEIEVPPPGALLQSCEGSGSRRPLCLDIPSARRWCLRKRIAAANSSFSDFSKELLTYASSSSAMPASLAEPKQRSKEDVVRSCSRVRKDEDSALLLFPFARRSRKLPSDDFQPPALMGRRAAGLGGRTRRYRCCCRGGGRSIRLLGCCWRRRELSPSWAQLGLAVGDVVWRCELWCWRLAHAQLASTRFLSGGGCWLVVVRRRRFVCESCASVVPRTAISIVLSKRVELSDFTRDVIYRIRHFSLIVCILYSY